MSRRVIKYACDACGYECGSAAEADACAKSDRRQKALDRLEIEIGKLTDRIALGTAIVVDRPVVEADKFVAELRALIERHGL